MANNWTPKIEKININSIMRAPTLAKEGIVTIIVLKIILRNLALLINRKTLPILKALTIVVCLGLIDADDI